MRPLLKVSFNLHSTTTRCYTIANYFTIQSLTTSLRSLPARFQHIQQIQQDSINMRFTSIVLLAAASSAYAQTDLSELLAAASSLIGDDPALASAYSSALSAATSLTAAMATNTALSASVASAISSYGAEATSLASQIATASGTSAINSLVSSASSRASEAASSISSHASSASSHAASGTSSAAVSSLTNAAGPLQIAGSVVGAGMLGLAILL